MTAFEAECQARVIPLWVLPLHSPKPNGHVERLNRTFRQEGGGVMTGTSS